jgi:spermidine synthase
VTLPWKTLASVETADGPLELRRRGEKDFLILIRGRVLMSSAAHRSEDALARHGCEGLKTRAKARVLVSGLGMGYTLRAALDELAADAQVVVAELNPVVVEWCAGPLSALTANAANDPRVKLEVSDVADSIADVAVRRQKPRFDSIILDMYEGPQSRLSPRDPLYGPSAVARVRDALLPGGTFAVWCEGKSPGFETSLQLAQFEFKLARAGKGARIHYIYVARKTAKP